MSISKSSSIVRRELDPKAVKLIISDGCPGMIRAIVA